MNFDEYSRVDLEHIVERQRPVVEAAELVAASWDGSRTGLTLVISKLAKAVRDTRVSEHVFSWCELCEELHCDYCAQTDDTEGADGVCEKRLASFTR